jgi:hypothetical protein
MAVGIGWVAFRIADQFPLLKWGWLGYNLIFTPFMSFQPISADQLQCELKINLSILDPIALLFLVVIASIVGGIAVFILAACLIFNYWEEETFRESKISVIVWALLHIIMGIPLWGVIPIAAVGFFFKYIYGKHSLYHAFTIHFATNATLLAIGFFLLLFSNLSNS